MSSSDHQRARLFAFAVLLVAVFCLGVYETRRAFPRSWATVISAKNDSESTKAQIIQLLDAVTVAGRVRAGSSVPLVYFHKLDGEPLRIVLVEGTFSTSFIEPLNTWTQIGHRVLLINSVDQDQTISGGISGQIGVGCEIDNAVGQRRLNIGDVAFRECNGAYREQSHVRWVANLAVVVWENPDSDKRPCWNAEAGDPRAKYQQCVADDTTTGVRTFFKELHQHPNLNPDAIVIPALGTGTGQLAKETFYRILFEQIYSELGRAKPKNKSASTIYLQVFGGEPPEGWSKTKNAISAALAEKVEDWSDAEHSTDATEWASFVGVAGGMSIFLVLSAMNLKVPMAKRDHTAFSRSVSLPLIFGWCSAAFGLATAAKSLLAFLSPWSAPWLQIAVGILAVPCCGPLLRAAQLFDKTVKPPEVALQQPGE
jgi:hypothetical protein